MIKKNICQNIFLLFILLTLLTSCIQQKNITYFTKNTSQPDTISIAQLYVPKIQTGDILSIYINSLNSAASSFFNPYSQGGANTGDNSSQVSAPALAQSSAPGYLVDASGGIELPLVGILKVEGLTTSQARDTIKNRLKLYLKEPTVNVRFLNYKVSLLGEVTRPAVYVIPNETITLPEALSLAGDLTIYGKRENILVIRSNNGKKEFGRVNLNSRDVYNSPYYYLHTNDVIYVEPGKNKVQQSDQIYRILPIVLSALSLLAIVLSRNF
jgi:polysaccharide export outer membrane protein